MKNNTIVIWSATLLFLAVKAVNGYAQNAEAMTGDYFHGSFTNEVRRMLAQDNPACELQAYIDKNNISQSDLVNVLKWFSENRGSPERGAFWSSQAISVMGRLKYDECIPYLEGLARKPERSLRVRAINSITQIGGKEAIAFAKIVVSDTNSFSSSDRLCLYDHIMRHSMSGFPEWDIVRKSSVEDCKMALNFLIAEPRSGEKLEWVLTSEENMARLMSGYRTNDARVAFLSFFCSNAPAPYRQQFVQRLENLRHELEAGGTPMAVTNSGEVVKSAMSNEKTAMPVMASHKAESPSPSLPLPAEKPVRLYVIWGFIVLLAVLAGFFLKTQLHR